MPLEPYPPALYEGGAALVTDPHPYVPGESAGAKVLSYQPHLLALRRARAAGAQDALRVDPQGQVVEGATSNVFVVFGRGLREPPASAGRLDGITARVVRGLAALEGFPVTATPVVPSEVYRADEVFITSSIREVMPVVEVDGRPISDGRPGPVARRLVEKYRAVARAR
jgi:branched-chain amino acid aminotransferase